MSAKTDDLRGYLNWLRQQMAVISYELKFRRLMMGLKAGFRPDQARDENGRWTDERGRWDAESESQVGEDVASGSGDVFSIFADLDSVPLADRIAQLTVTDADEDPSSPKTVGATVTYRNAVTGDERIDKTTERLTITLKGVTNTFDFIPYSTPRLDGTAVHSAFGIAVRAQDMDGVKVELSYMDEKEVIYGSEGSVRADVALRSIGGEIIAIYDLRTGGAVVSSSRADELRSHFTASRYVPVIELHVVRGSRIKHATFGPYFRSCPEAASRLNPVW